MDFSRLTMYIPLQWKLFVNFKVFCQLVWEIRLGGNWVTGSRGSGWLNWPGRPTGCHQKPQAEAVLGVSPFAAEQELNNCWSLFMCPAPDSKVHRTWPKWPKCAIYIIAIYYSASQQGGPPESLRYRLGWFSTEDNAEWYQPIQSG